MLYNDTYDNCKSIWSWFGTDECILTWRPWRYNLHGELGGFVEDMSEVCLLKKCLYGWNKSQCSGIDEHSFAINDNVNCVYILNMNDEVIIYLLIYVNDILMKIYSNEDINKFYEILNGEFKIKDLSQANRIL